MRWLALSVEADVEAVEAVTEILGRLGRGSAIEPLELAADAADEQALRPDPEAGYRVTVWIPDDADAPAALERTQRALWHLRAFDLRPMSALSVTTTDDAAWATAWRDGYRARPDRPPDHRPQLAGRPARCRSGGSSRSRHGLRHRPPPYDPGLCRGAPGLGRDAGQRRGRGLRVRDPGHRGAQAGCGARGRVRHGPPGCVDASNQNAAVNGGGRSVRRPRRNVAGGADAGYPLVLANWSGCSCDRAGAAAGRPTGDLGTAHRLGLIVPPRRRCSRPRWPPRGCWSSSAASTETGSPSAWSCRHDRPPVLRRARDGDGRTVSRAGSHCPPGHARPAPAGRRGDRRAGGGREEVRCRLDGRARSKFSLARWPPASPAIG